MSNVPIRVVGIKLLTIDLSSGYLPLVSGPDRGGRNRSVCVHLQQSIGFQLVVADHPHRGHSRPSPDRPDHLRHRREEEVEEAGQVRGPGHGQRKRQEEVSYAPFGLRL